MRLIPISLLILFGVMLYGCQGGDVKGVDAVSATTGGSLGDSGEPVTDSPGSTGGSSTAMPEGGTSDPGVGTPPTAGTPGGTPSSMPSGSTAAAPEAVKSISIPMYPGSTEDPENKDSSVPTDDGTQTVVTRLTSDSFDKVRDFYSNKVKWTEKTEVEGLVIYEFTNGKNKEVLGINDRGDKRSIQITKLESK